MTIVWRITGNVIKTALCCAHNSVCAARAAPHRTVALCFGFCAFLYVSLFTAQHWAIAVWLGHFPMPRIFAKIQYGVNSKQEINVVQENCHFGPITHYTFLGNDTNKWTLLQRKMNRTLCVLCQMVTMPVTLSDPNYRKSPLFCKFISGVRKPISGNIYTYLSALFVFTWLGSSKLQHNYCK